MTPRPINVSKGTGKVKRALSQVVWCTEDSNNLRPRDGATTHEAKARHLVPSDRGGSTIQQGLTNRDLRQLPQPLNEPLEL